MSAKGDVDLKRLWHLVDELELVCMNLRAGTRGMRGLVLAAAELAMPPDLAASGLDYVSDGLLDDMAKLDAVHDALCKAAKCPPAASANDDG